MRVLLIVLALFACVASPVSAQSSFVFAALDTTTVHTGDYLAGWALNCATQQQPTSLIVYAHARYPDGKPVAVHIPVVVIWRGYRPDVSAAIGTNCGGIRTRGVSAWVGWYALPISPLPPSTSHLTILFMDTDYAQTSGSPNFEYGQVSRAIALVP